MVHLSIFCGRPILVFTFNYINLTLKVGGKDVNGDHLD